MTSRRKLSEFGAASNGGGVEGIIRSALDSIDEGGTLVFDAIRYEGNTSPSFEYAVFSPIVLSKSVFIEGESSDIRIVNKSVNSAAFIVQPLRDNFFVGFENLSLISGTTGILFTGSHTLSPNSRIYNVALSGQALHGIKSTIPEVNLHLENIWVYGGQQFGFHFENNRNHVNLSIDRVKIENTTIAAIHFSNIELNSGSVYISETELNDNNQAIVVDNLRYYEHNVEYFQNQANYVLSGASVRLTGSAGGGGGGGVTDHGGLTGLGDDDHKQYLLVNGSRGMSGSINMNGFNITDVGTIDGVDVSAVNNTLDAHILDVDNPHSTKFSNLVPQTLADLNAAISDGNVVSEATFNENSASLNSFTASVQAFTATIVSFTASVQSLTSSLISTSASHELSINALLNSSGTFNSQIQTLFNVSASHTSQINPLKAATASLQSATASLQSATASLQTVSASLIAASASYRSELNFQTASINLLTAASSTFRSQLNSQTASIVSLQAFSSSHYLRHLSGAADQINAQDLGANGIGINRVLISNGLGGWTTVLSSAFGSGGSGGTPDPHAASHLSGASDPIDAHLLRANGIGRDRVLIADGLGGWITVLSSAIGIYDHGALTGLADNDHPQYALSSVVNAMSASLQEATASLQSATASLQTVSSSYLAVSASYNTLSASYINFSNSLNAASATFAERLNVLTNASATFRAELNSQTASIARLDAASGTFRSELTILNNASATFRSELTALTSTVVRLDSASGTFRTELNIITAASSTFRTELNSQTASIVVLQAFSSSHASRHLSGGVDPIDAQLLRGNGVGENRLLISNGAGGWTTVLSTSVGLPAGAPGAHAASHLSGGSDQLSAQQLAADGIAENRILISNAAGGWTTILSNSISGKDYDAFTASVQSTTASLLAASSSFETRTGVLTNASATFRTELTSLTSSVVRLDAASGTFRTELNILNAASATFRAELDSQTASIARLDSASGTFRTELNIITAASSTFRTELTALTNSVVRLDSASGTFRSELTLHTASISLLTAASSTFRTELTALTSTVTRLDAASGTFRTELNIITAASSTFRNELNSQTASIVVLQAFSQSHGSGHLSGAVDQINAQDLGANGIAVNRLLISNADGGWTTIPSGSITGKDYDAFTASVQLTTASLLAASASFNSSITVLTNASATFRNELNSQTASISRLDAASGTFRNELNSQTASINLLTAASSTFRTELTALTSTVTRLDAASGTYRSELTALTNASATFRAELNFQTASIVRLDSASGTFVANINSQTASINLLTAASSTFRTELNSQTASIARLDAASGTFRSELTILTNASATFRTELTALTNSVVRLDNASGTFRSELTLHTASINLLTAASSTFRTELTALTSTVVRLDAVSGTFRSELTILNNASATFRTELTALTSTVVRLDAASGTFRTELNSQTASIVVLQAFSSSHASRHLSGAVDPIDAQLLRGDGLSPDRVLVSDGLGGWKTVASSSIATTINYSGSAIPSKGFYSMRTTDYFTASTTGTMPGSSSFVAVVLYMPFFPISNTNVHTLLDTYVADNGQAEPGGFKLSISYQQLHANAYTVGGGGAIVDSTITTWDPRHAFGNLYPYALRVRGASATSITASVWSGVAKIGEATSSAAFSTAPNSKLFVGWSNNWFGDDTALSGGIYGIGYYEGDLNDDQMRTLLGRCLSDGEIPTDVINWTLAYRGEDLVTVESQISASIGGAAKTLVKIGSPSGSTAFISPGTGGRLISSPGNHAITHISGGVDPIDAQLLRGDGIAINRLLISNGSGGWTTIASQSVGGAGGKDYDSFTASVQTTTASLLAASSSFETRIGVLTNASATFRSELNSQTASITLLNSASSSYRTELTALTSTVVRLDAASGTFRSELNVLNAASATFRAELNSQTASINLLTATSSTFRTELTALTSSVVRMDAASGTFRNELTLITASINLLTAASSTFRTELNSQTASIVTLQAFSSSHASRHLSGGADPIDAQSLRANNIAVNQLLISNAVGGWTTVASQSVGGAAGSTYSTSSILSILNETGSVWLRADTSLSGADTSITYWGDITSNANHATHSVVSECPTYISQSVFFDGIDNRLNIKDVGSTLDPSNCFIIGMRVKPSNYSGSRFWLSKGAFGIQDSSELRVWLNTPGSTGAAIPLTSIPANLWHTLVVLWDGTQATNQTKLRMRVDGIEMSCSYYGTIPASVGAYGTDLSVGCQVGDTQFFSGAMREVFLSKMVPTMAQVLEVERVLTNGPGTLIAHAGTHLSGGLDYLDAQNLGATGIAANRLLISNLSGGWTTLATGSMTDALNAASASYRAELNSQTASIVTLQAFSTSHASRHLSGGVDPIDAQSLRGDGLAIDRLLISDGLGGWTTIPSSSVVDNLHGQFHLSGAKDALNVQSLGASGIAVNQLLISNADGGWTTVASQSVGGGGGGITNVQSASTEGRSLLSGVFGGIAYIKTLKSITASIDGLAISDTSPVQLSSSDDTVYIKRRPTSAAAFLFEDFIGGVTTAAGFSWTFVAGGTGASIQTDNVSNANRETYMGSAVGVISLDTGTTAAGGCTIWGGQSSFSIRQLTASSIEWRLVASGSSSAASQDYRVQFGWFNTVLSGVRRPTTGIFFEMTASNRATWNIVAISGASTTAYATSEPINSASFMKYKIETVQNPIGAFTSSFYVNDILIGAISTSLPISRNQPVGPAARIVKEIGIGQRDLFIDWCELFYEINR